MRLASLIFVAALVSACDASAPLTDEASAPIELTPVEQAEVTATFDDAACVCEAVTLLRQSELDWQLLYGTGTGTSIDVRRKLLRAPPTADAALSAYIASHPNPLPPGGRAFCRVLSPTSARGVIPRRTLGDDATSSCVAEWNASPLSVTSRSNPVGPLCAAEFDYCLGNELRLEANSFVNGPSSAAVRVELERLALGRTSKAIQGYGVQLSECDARPTAAGCSVLLQSGAATPLAKAVGARFADAVDTVAELAGVAHEDLLALSDAIPPPGESPADFVSAVWNGPTGRGASIRPLYGSGGAAIPETTTAHDDLSVVRMLRLVDLYDGPMPFARVILVTMDSTTGVVSRRTVYRAERLLPSAGPARDTRVAALFNLLDLRIAVARTGDRTPEFAEGVVVDPGLVARVGNGEAIRTSELPLLSGARLRSSPLREVFRLEPAHMAAAMDLAFDVLSTMQVHFASRVALDPFAVSDGVNEFYSVDINEIAQRDDRDLLWRRQELDSAAAPVPDATIAIRAGDTNAWYRAALDPDDVGASNVLHSARVVARRLAASPRPLRSVIDATRVASAVDALVGPSWTEFSRDQVVPVKRGPSLTPRARPLWVLYSPVAAPEGAIYYLAYGATADCLRYGPPGGQGTCAPLLASDKLAPCTTAPWAGIPGGILRTSCSLPSNPATSAGTYYIVRAVPDEADGWTYSVIDRVPTTRNAVHTLGGAWEETGARSVARSSLAPAFPALNSLGLPRSFVPPLENSLTSGGAPGEDSWRAYLDAAQAQSDSAATALTAARMAEVRALLNAVSDDARLEDSATQARYEMSDLCGDAASCASERTTVELRSLPFRDLVDGLTTVAVVALDAPPVPPPSSASLCESLLTEYLVIADSTGADSASAPGELRARLNCLRWFVDQRLGEASLDRFPLPVVEQLGESVSGDFAGFSGQKREIFIRMFDSLAKIHTQQRAFKASIQAALTRIDVLELNLVSLDESWRWASCYLRVASSAISMCAGISNGANVSYGEGSVSRATALRVSADATASVADFANIGKCDTGDAQAQLVLGASAGVAESLASAYMVLDELMAARADVDLAITDLDTLEGRATAATARVANAGAILSTDAVEDLEEWKIHQGAEATRARASLRRAQISTFVARRAIEFRTITNLSTRTAPEPFVDAPSTWADSLSAIQFASEAGVSIAPEGITDYILDLQAFMDGYPFAQRFAEGQDTATVSLRSYLFETGRRLPAAGPEGTYDPLPGPVWKFLRYTCGDGTIESAPQEFADGILPCAAHELIAYAELEVLADEGAGSPFGRRLGGGGYNYRIAGLGMNLVGAQLINCEVLPPAARASCRGDGNVQYALSQSPIVRATDWDGREVAFDAGPGRIQGARALAAERYLTTPLSAADRELITPYMRRELVGRPLFSEFRVRLYNRVGLDWTRLDDIQFVVDYVRWEQQR